MDINNAKRLIVKQALDTIAHAVGYQVFTLKELFRALEETQEEEVLGPADKNKKDPVVAALAAKDWQRTVMGGLVACGILDASENGRGVAVAKGYRVLEPTRAAEMRDNHAYLGWLLFPSEYDNPPWVQAPTDAGGTSDEDAAIRLITVLDKIFAAVADIQTSQRQTLDRVCKLELKNNEQLEKCVALVASATGDLKRANASATSIIEAASNAVSRDREQNAAFLASIKMEHDRLIKLLDMQSKFQEMTSSLASFKGSVGSVKDTIQSVSGALNAAAGMTGNLSAAIELVTDMALNLDAGGKRS